MSAGKGDKNRVKDLKKFQNNYDEINWGKPPNPVYTTTEFIYTWPNGREEVRYRRPYNSKAALNMIEEIRSLPNYSFRHV